MLDVPLLHAAFDHSPCGVAFYDRDRRFVAVNAAFAAMSGRAAAEHAGRPLDEILPRQAAQISPHILSVFATGRPITGIALDGFFATSAPPTPATGSPTTTRWASTASPPA